MKKQENRGNESTEDNDILENVVLAFKLLLSKKHAWQKGEIGQEGKVTKDWDENWCNSNNQNSI